MTFDEQAVVVPPPEERKPALYSHLGDVLCDQNIPLHRRFRALFTLRHLADKGAVEAISRGFDDPSVLLKHELAYVLGQMQCPDAISHLIQVLEARSQDAMVRHEAAEALGALADPVALPYLIAHFNDKSNPATVRDTCELAIERIRLEQRRRDGLLDLDDSKAIVEQTYSIYDFHEIHTFSLYSSVDPAPATAKSNIFSTDELETVLLDNSRPLFERYRAMFALRNRGDESSVLALAKGLNDSNALFRHEIAYVFGQMQHPASVPALVESLSQMDEEPMVRHECAEALGSVATPEVFPILEKFRNDPERVVRESCIVALDMYEHETSGSFQYADGLKDAIAANNA